MNVIKLALKPETALPMLALLAASGVTVALVCGRVLWTGNIHYAGLIWNLFLAWLPVPLALLAADRFERSSHRDWKFGGLAAAWLLFFPNSAYICTDILHLLTRTYLHFWTDLVVVLLCAFTGLVLGFLSLYLMQGVAARAYGTAISWGFVAVSSVLGSFGIYLGRFMRFNSWDVVTKPGSLYRGIGRWAADPFAHSTSFVFPTLFAVFLFITYLMLYALTHLHPSHGGPPPAEAELDRALTSATPEEPAPAASRSEDPR